MKDGLIQALTTLVTNIAEIFKVKSLVTLSLTAVLIAMLTGSFNPSQEFVALFCTSYGSIVTYFFTRKEKEAAELAEAEKEAETFKTAESKGYFAVPDSDTPFISGITYDATYKPDGDHQQ